jgi:S-adenosylmethionine:tRNA ribosyltransferase-isomerase
MLVLHRDGGSIEHRHFRDIVEYVPAGDVVVVNASKVFRARLLGTRENGARAEVMLLRPVGDKRFEALVHPGGKLHEGRTVTVAPDLVVRVERVTDRRTRIVHLETPQDAWAAIEKYGHVPLPPYIARADQPADAASYQTVFAREPGSAAAPTAGLHFTSTIAGELQRRGAIIAEVVLHVGAGTFKPVTVEDPGEHVMHEEWYAVPPSTASAIADARRRGGKVWAVGTTAVRTLETCASEGGMVQAGTGETRIFIRPPYKFRVVDRLLTNFHLPRSTLIMLVAAFAGYSLTMDAYAEAVRWGYRFYSYGDAMMVI